MVHEVEGQSLDFVHPLPLGPVRVSCALVI
jgi:hypothetical protein